MSHELQIALIREPDCIGCALCLKVCPTDAILGASRHLHTVITDDCTGCRKCIPVCPTDCITMLPRADASTPPAVLATRWRKRYQARKARLARERRRHAEMLQARATRPGA